MSRDRGWNANFLIYELVTGVAPAAALVVWSEAAGGSATLSRFLANHGALLYTVTAPIAGAMLGFILAAAAIIVTAASDDRMTMLRQSKHYDDLWGCFRSAMRFLGLGTIAAVVGLVVTDPTGERVVFFVVIAVGVVAALRVARAIWAVNWVIRIFTGPSLERAAGAVQW